MKICILSDIHANLPALESVLTHAKEHHARLFWNAGDSLGYGAFPNQVVNTLRKEGIFSIFGNYDQKVLESPQKKAGWIGKKMPEKILAFTWAYQQLTKINKQYLYSLPSQQQAQIKGWQILMVHASPLSLDEHLTPETLPKRFKQLAAATKANIVICGHSHQPFSYATHRTLFINPGSVGRPDDGDPRSSYVLLTLQKDYLKIQFFRIEYNINQAVEAIRNNHLPEDFAQMIIRGQNLEKLRTQN